MNEIKNEQTMAQEQQEQKAEVAVVEAKKESKVGGFFKKVGNGVKKHGKTALAIGGGVLVGVLASAAISKFKDDNDSGCDDYDSDYDEDDAIDVDYEDVDDVTDEE